MARAKNLPNCSHMHKFAITTNRVCAPAPPHSFPSQLATNKNNNNCGPHIYRIKETPSHSHTNNKSKFVNIKTKTQLITSQIGLRKIPPLAQITHTHTPTAKSTKPNRTPQPGTMAQLIKSIHDIKTLRRSPRLHEGFYAKNKCGDLAAYLCEADELTIETKIINQALVWSIKPSGLWFRDEVVLSCRRMKKLLPAHQELYMKSMRETNKAHWLKIINKNPALAHLSYPDARIKTDSPYRLPPTPPPTPVKIKTETVDPDDTSETNTTEAARMD